MVALREETGLQRSLTDRLVMSRLQWAGHVERMAEREKEEERECELSACLTSFTLYYLRGLAFATW